MHADTDQKLEMENPVREHLENIVSVLLILEIGMSKQAIIVCCNFSHTEEDCIY